MAEGVPWSSMPGSCTLQFGDHVVVLVLSGGWPQAHLP